MSGFSQWIGWSVYETVSHEISGTLGQYEVVRFQYEVDFSNGVMMFKMHSMSMN